MAIRSGQGGTLTFAGRRIGQVTYWRTHEGEGEIDSDRHADTEIHVDVQWDTAAGHTIALYARGTASIVTSAGVNAATLADAELIRREVYGGTRQLVTGRLVFRSTRLISW